jgi:hypothetical protein
MTAVSILPGFAAEFIKTYEQFPSSQAVLIRILSLYLLITFQIEFIQHEMIKLLITEFSTFA